jgi:NAD(P)-dependent dehydrogenase (short-subunit alcohol dehydrogenase family)
MTSSMFSPTILAGRSIVVTGGGSGLGLAMARAFAAHGARVTICGRRSERLEEAAADIGAAAREGGAVETFVADVRESAQCEALIGRAAERFGSVDGLVNNAAGNFLAFSDALTPNGFDAVVKTVLYGTVQCTLAFGRYLLERKRPGAVVSIAATYVWSGTAFALPSACAKAGVLAMTRSLAVEWGAAGIRLNAIAPGPVPTEGAFSRLIPTPEAEAAALSRIPEGRFGNPEEIANLAIVLLSDLCPYQTGDCVTADGGEWLAGAGEFSDLRKVPREKLRAKFDALRPKKSG